VIINFVISNTLIRNFVHVSSYVSLVSVNKDVVMCSTNKQQKDITFFIDVLIDLSLMALARTLYTTVVTFTFIIQCIYCFFI
jgi:hypothetical protein